VPLAKITIPNDLVMGDGCLNRRRYPVLERVEGEPTPTTEPNGMVCEAYAALRVAQRWGQGRNQFVYLGVRAAQYLYPGGRPQGTPDCDVVGRISIRGSMGFLVGEGKGTDILHAYEQLVAAAALIAARRDAMAPVVGGLVVAHALRYLEWTNGRWVAYHIDGTIDVNTTNRWAEHRPGPYLTDMAYLLGGRVDAEQRPMWAVNKQSRGGKPWNEADPYLVWVHERSVGERALRQLRIGSGQLQLFYVNVTK
jgi:hypothetical protein